VTDDLTALLKLSIHAARQKRLGVNYRETPMPRLTPEQHAIKALERQRMSILGQIEQLKIRLANTDKLIAEMTQRSGSK
jgi:hypothetical protein